MAKQESSLQHGSLQQGSQSLKVIQDEFKSSKIVSLSRLSTLKIGGEALLVEIESLKELERLFEFLEPRGWPYLVLGGASNLLLPDGMLRAPVIKLGGELATVEIQHGGQDDGQDDRQDNGEDNDQDKGQENGQKNDEKNGHVNDRHIEVGAGFSLPMLLARARQEHLTGLEYLAGVPGTVGGAVCGNAGSRDEAIAEKLVSIKGYSPTKGFFELEKGDFTFGYRSLELPKELGKCVLTGFGLKLARAKQEQIQADMTEALERKKRSQPVTQPSLGCVFKNPKGESAGRLIDQAGLKGRKCGGAMVSEIHANFIVNVGGACAGDYLGLARRIRDEVRKMFDVVLEPEIKIVNLNGEYVDLDYDGAAS
jgi:UDP-N-acetylmuramate dehydrogenase